MTNETSPCLSQIRKPVDPRYKTLIELATKEKVEKELKERESKILNN